MLCRIEDDVKVRDRHRVAMSVRSDSSLVYVCTHSVNRKCPSTRGRNPSDREQLNNQSVHVTFKGTNKQVDSFKTRRHATPALTWTCDGIEERLVLVAAQLQSSHQSTSPEGTADGAVADAPKRDHALNCQYEYSDNWLCSN